MNLYFGYIYIHPQYCLLRMHIVERERLHVYIFCHGLNCMRLWICWLSLCRLEYTTTRTSLWHIPCTALYWHPSTCMQYASSLPSYLLFAFLHSLCISNSSPLTQIWSDASLINYLYLSIFFFLIKLNHCSPVHRP